MTDKSSPLTERQAIIAVLEEASEPLSIRDISKQAGISEKDILSHLGHIRSTLQQQSSRLRIIAAQCRECGFQFTKRKDFKKPSRCPRCRSEYLQPPRFIVSQG